MNKKQLTLSVLSTALVASMAASAFAAPKAGVYIGGNVDKYYSFDSMLNDQNLNTFLDEMIDTIPDVVYVSAEGEAKGGLLGDLLFASNPKEQFVDVTDQMFADIDGAEGFYTVNDDGTVGSEKVKPDGTPGTTPGELKVESVSAINLNQVEVAFSTKVDKTSAENLANYVVASGATNAALNVTGTWTESPKATLKEDGKTVLITFDTVANGTHQGLTNQVEATITVAGVKSEDGSKTLASTANKVTVVDTTVPTVESVSMSGNKTINVKFSEYVKADQATTVANYQLNGVSLSAYGAGTPDWNAETNTVSIPLSSALANGVYKLKVSVNNTIEDKTGLKVVAVEKDLTVQTDETVAALSAVEVASNKASITLKFTKALPSTGFATGAPLVIDGVNVIASPTIAKTIENGNLKLTPVAPGTDFNAIIGAGLHAVNVKSGTTTDFFTDAYGVKVAVGSTSYTVVNDTTKPVVTSATVLPGSTQIEVKFSEAVDASTALNRFNYTVTSSTGTTITANSAAFKAGTTDAVVLTFNNGFAPGNYSLVVVNVKDLSANVIDPFNTAFVVADTTAPQVQDVLLGTGTNANSIYVYYNEPVNPATAGLLANYLYDNKAFPSGTTITALTNSSYKITVPTGTTLQAGKNFAISNNVTDLAGNKLAGLGYQQPLSGAPVTNSLDLPASGTNVKVIDTKTVQVTLNKELKSVDASDFLFNTTTSGGAFTGTVNQQGTTYVNSAGKSTITFKFDNDVVDEAGFVTGSTLLAVAVKQSGTYGTAAVDDSTFQSTALGGVTGTNVSDKIAPVLATTDPIQTVDSDGNGFVDTITVEFTEALNPSFLSATSFEVAGYTIASVGLASGNAKVVVITVDEADNADTDATPGVKRVGTVKDVAGNEFTGLSTASAAVDKAVPVLVAGELSADKKTVTLTFSEAIVNGTASAVLLKAAVTLATDGTTYIPLASADEVTIDGNKLVVELASALTTATNKVKVATGALEDASENATDADAVTGALDATSI